MKKTYLRTIKDEIKDRKESGKERENVAKRLNSIKTNS